MGHQGPRAIYSSGVVEKVSSDSRRAISALTTFFLATLVFASFAPRAEANGQLKLKPDILQFGNVSVGLTNTVSVTITNTGNGAATMSGETLTGAGYSLIGLALPKTLNAGATTTFMVKFAPQKTGTLNGSLTILSNAGNSTFVVPLYGTGTASTAKGHVSTSVNSAQFGNVTVGAKSSQSIQLKNDGAVSVTVTGVTAANTGFSVSGITTPLTIAPGATAQFSANFSPTKAGSYAGSVTIASTAADSNIMVTLSGTGTASGGSGHISSSMNSAQFGNVPVGTKNTQSIQLKNDGKVNLTVTGVTAANTGFSVSGITPPVTLAPGATAQFQAGFLPTKTGSYAGSITIASTAADSKIMVSLTGTGISSSQALNVSPTSVAFGNVPVNSSATKQITLTNAGNSSISISGDSVSGTGLSATGLGSGVTLTAGQSVALTATFAPKTTGSISGSIIVTSNATNTSITIPVTGAGVSASHMVALQWQPSATEGVVGYNVYRSTVSGGSYVKLTSSALAGTAYSDTNVVSGTEYYYVVTAVSSDGTESAYSNQVVAKIP